MIETQIRQASPVRAAADVAPMARLRESRGRRWRLRLWTILNAQALMDGVAGDRDGVVLIEDDHQRLARRGN